MDRLLAMGRLRIPSLFFVGFLVGVACEDDGGVSNGGSLVGGSCHDDHDCEHQCQRGDKFPDGTCTSSCDHDGDCPDGSICIDRNGGICLLTCDHDDDCRRDYNCDNQNREGSGGDAHVCIDD